VVKSELPGPAKLDLLLDFDRVFGLGLDRVPTAYDVPQTLLSAVRQRSTLRNQEDFSSADSLRSNVLAQGYLLQDTATDSRVRPKTPLERHAERWPSLSSSREVESLLDQTARFDFTFILNAYNYVEDVQRCVNSMWQCADGRSAEVIVVDNGSTDGTGDWLEEFQSGHPHFRVFHCDHVIGDAAGKNIGLKQSRGKHIIIVDASTEVVGDLLTPVQQRLADDSVGIFGPYGLSTDDMRHFHEEVELGEADAIQAYCMAFCRETVKKVGLMHEGFRFYRNLDIDYSFQFKEKGYSIFADSTLPLVRHEHRQWTELDENQRDELSRKNFGRFLRRWGHRPDLLIAANGQAFDTGFHH
jgi:GT2 family glycosyltransferase